MKTLLMKSPAKSASARPAAAVPARKLFYRIQEVAQMTGLKPYVLRYWETEFRELAPAKDASDQRRYRPSDIETVLTIRKLLYEDRYTIEGARKRLREALRVRRGGASADAAPAVPARSKPGSRAATHRAPAASPRRIDLTLLRLRMEVNELLNLLS